MHARYPTRFRLASVSVLWLCAVAFTCPSTTYGQASYEIVASDNQVWTLEPASDGYVRIVARHSGKAIDVEFASGDDGARVIQ